MKTQEEVAAEIKEGTTTLEEAKQYIVDGECIIEDKYRWLFASLLAKKSGGKLWVKHEGDDSAKAIKHLRVYSAGHKNSYAEINADGINIDNVARGEYNSIIEIVEGWQVIPHYCR